MALALVALLVLVQSAERFLFPVPIQFDQAIAVAAAGLLVNLVSALLLRDDQHHDHDHDHGDSGHRHRDHNLKAAYLHVLADALTAYGLRLTTARPSRPADAFASRWLRLGRAEFQVRGAMPLA